MDILIPEYKIKRRIQSLAYKLSEEHKASGNTLPPVMICVLNGAFPFFADLIKDMDIDIEIDFIRPKSYEGRDNSNGVTFTKDLELELKGKRVYIVEDVIETGQTLIEILSKVESRIPAEVKVVTLIHKKTNAIKPDYFCFEIDNHWIAGYGFDDNGLKRNYRNIYKL